MKKNKRILVTGGTGYVGRWVITDLLRHGFQVANVDLRKSDLVETYQVDLHDFDKIQSVFSNADAIIHLAAIRSLTKDPPQKVFSNNVVTTFNVLEVALLNKVNKIILASSEAVLGLAFKYTPLDPFYLPVDENHILLPQDAYALSKLTGEQLAAGFCRRHPAMSIISLRFAWILQPFAYQQELTRAWSNSQFGAAKLFAYVDVRDVTSAIRLSVESQFVGNAVLFIAASDTLMHQKTYQLINQHFPNVKEVRQDFDNYNSLINCALAKEIIEFRPQFSWRDIEGLA